LEFCTPLLLWGKRGKKRVKKAKNEDEMAEAGFTWLVARYILKNNRKTISPEQSLVSAGLMLTD
jgi:hypothetical protein